MFLWRGLHKGSLARLLHDWSRMPAANAQARPAGLRPQPAARPAKIAAAGPER